jgi:hypothetical protein
MHIEVQMNVLGLLTVGMIGTEMKRRLSAYEFEALKRSSIWERLWNLLYKRQENQVCSSGRIGRHRFVLQFKI